MSDEHVRSKKIVIFSLYLTYLLDLASLVFVFVIFSAMLADPTSTFTATMGQNRNIWIGVILGIYSFALFFGAPILGDLSDRFGRKPILLLSLLGTILGSAFSAIAIGLENITLLCISRLVSGLFAGNITISQASLSELVPYEKQQRYMAMLAGVGGLAWTLGPFIASILSNRAIAPFFSFATPFWFMALSFSIVALLLYKHFEIAKPTEEGRKVSLSSMPSRLREVIRYPGVPMPFLISSVSVIGWMMYQGFLGSYLIEKFGFYEQIEGDAYAFSSFFWFLGGLLAQLWIFKRYRAHKALSFFLFLSGITILLFFFVSKKPFVWPLFAIANMAFAISFSCFMGIFSTLTPHQLQGKLFGAWNASFALSSGVGIVCAGILAGLGLNSPYITSAIILMGSALLYTLGIRKKT